MCASRILHFYIQVSRIYFSSAYAWVSHPLPLPSHCTIHMHAHHIFAYQVSVCRVMLLIDKVLRLQRFQLEFHLRNFAGKSAFYVFGQFGVNNFAKQRKWWKLTFPYGTKVIAWWIWIRTWKKNICKAPTADEDSHKAKLIKRNW